MAKIIIIAVGAMVSRPFIIIGPKLVKPPNKAKTIGTTVNALKADKRLLMIKYINTTIIEKPKNVNILYPL